MLMGIPLSPQSALKAQDNKPTFTGLAVAFPRHIFFSPYSKQKMMIPCRACYLSAALTEVKVLIEALGHLLDLQLF